MSIISMTSYFLRLIEVDLPIQRISAHARRKESTWNGYVRALHANYGELP